MKFYSDNPKFILPETRKNEVISFVKSGLKDLSISRKSFSWGIKVPSNKDPLKFCDEISKTFKDLSSILNLSNDDFIRTTEKRHFVSVENLWNILEKKGENISFKICWMVFCIR